jgi:hypothetical protein
MRAAIIAVLLLATSRADAQPQDPWKDPSPPGFIGAELSLRLPIRDSLNERTYDHVDGYGYDGAPAAGALGLYGGYQLLPLVDVGAATEYWSSSSGTAPGSSDELTTTGRMYGAFVRGKIRHPSRLMEMASRIETGLIDSNTTLRGRSLKEWSSYVRMRVEFVLGPEWLRASLQFSYTAAFGADDFDPYPAPALGGLSFGAGVSHRF